MDNVSIRFKRDDGANFYFDGTDWKILSDGMTGFDFPPVEVFTEDNATEDGSIVTGKRVKARTCEVKAVNKKSKNGDKKTRERFSSFFIPKRSYSLYITYANRTLLLENAEITASALYTKNIYSNLECDIQFLANYPYYKGTSPNDSYSGDFLNIESLLEFPLAFTPDGLEFSLVSGAYNNYFVNNGDVDTFVRVEIRAKGDVVNPSVVIGTHGFVKIKDTMQVGDVYVIDAEKHMLYKNNEKSIKHLERTSLPFTQFTLYPHTNTQIAYNADSGIDNMDVKISYQSRYYSI